MDAGPPGEVAWKALVVIRAVLSGVVLDYPGLFRAPGAADRTSAALWAARTCRRVGGMANEPTPFEVHESGAYFHGTKADLKVGEMLEPGRLSNYGTGRNASFVYVTQTLDAATWGAELAAGDGPGRIYVVEPTGTLEDDPDVTDKRFPGNPTRSYRTRQPLRVVGEVADWVGHSSEKFREMRERLADLEREGIEAIDD